MGTDTDYLETSRLRGIFRENAIIDADVTLFEMPNDSDGTGGDGALGFPPTPIDLEFRSRSFWHQLIHIPPAVVMVGMSTPLQIFHQTKFYIFTIVIVAVLVYIIFRIDRTT